MSVAVKLSNKLVEQAKHSARIYHRSVPKQIEYLFNIGRIAEENQDLSYSFIKDILFSLEEVKDKKLEEYKFN